MIRWTSVLLQLVITLPALGILVILVIEYCMQFRKKNQNNRKVQEREKDSDIDSGIEV